MGQNSVEVIVLNSVKWLNEKNIEEGLDHANLTVLTKKHLLKYRKHRYKLVDEPK